MKKNLIVDYRLNNEEKYNLSKMNYTILECPVCNSLYDAVCAHPDMLMNILNDKKIIVSSDINKSFIKNLKDLNYEVILSNSHLSSKYPYDIILNAVNTKCLFMHYLNYTDSTLLNSIHDKKVINVKQGYTKCSTAVVADNAFITSDTGIYNSLIKENFDVLLIPAGDIILPHLDYGFIGGTCGLIEKNIMAFYGNLDFYKYGNEVKTFLKKYNVEPLYLRNGRLIDRGSILRLW